MSDEQVDLMDAYLAARDAMIGVVKHVLAGHRPERLAAQKVVTCTEVYADAPHAVLVHQWPAWRDHVAPLIVDALFELMMPVIGEPS